MAAGKTFTDADMLVVLQASVYVKRADRGDTGFLAATRHVEPFAEAHAQFVHSTLAGAGEGRKRQARETLLRVSRRVLTTSIDWSYDVRAMAAQGGA